MASLEEVNVDSSLQRGGGEEVTDLLIKTENFRQLGACPAQLVLVVVHLPLQLHLHPPQPAALHTAASN